MSQSVSAYNYETFNRSESSAKAGDFARPPAGGRGGARLRPPDP